MGRAQRRLAAGRQVATAIKRLAEEAGRARLVAGVSFPSDVEAGSELGRRVAQAVMERVPVRQKASPGPSASAAAASPGTLLIPPPRTTTSGSSTLITITVPAPWS